MVRMHFVGDVALPGSCLGNGYPSPLGLSHAGSFLDPSPASLYIARHDDHDDDPPRQPPPRPFGAGGRSLIVTRAAEGRGTPPNPRADPRRSDREGLSHG